MLQVIDTPYLVNPEWKNFIPGYLYNDSDLELTAESFYRQDKLVLYVFRRLCFVRTPLRCGALADDSSPRAPPAVAAADGLICILYLHLGYRSAPTPPQKKERAFDWLTGVFCFILLPAGRSAASVMQQRTVFPQMQRMQMRAQLLTLSS